MAFTFLSKALLGTVVVSSYLAAGYLGDSANIKRRLIHPFLYGGLAIEEGFTHHPFAVHHDLEISSHNTLQLYQHNSATGERLPVREDGSVHGVSWKPCQPETLTIAVQETVYVATPETLYVNPSDTGLMNRVRNLFQSLPLNTH